MAKKKTTPEFKAAFLAMLAELPNITVVSKLLGISPSNVSVARRADPEFDEAVLEAINQGYDMIEEEARRRAVEGVLTPVFYEGEEVGQVRKYSDQLLVMLLKGYKPKKFNRGVTAKFDGGGAEKITMTFDIDGDG